MAGPTAWQSVPREALSSSLSLENMLPEGGSTVKNSGFLAVLFGEDCSNPLEAERGFA
jgi:hypothetical protein